MSSSVGEQSDLGAADSSEHVTLKVRGSRCVDLACLMLLSFIFKVTNMTLLEVGYCLLTCCPPGCPVCGQALKVSWFDAHGVEVGFERILIPLALSTS